MKTSIAVSFLCWSAAAASAQHCGGPCEIPRGAGPVASNPRFTLSEGIETANWRYLFNWFWTEDGVQKHRLEAALGAPPLSDFGYRRMFVSPAGNGFLVTGNPYAGKRLHGREPPLFVFCDPEGHRLLDLSLFDAVPEDDRRLGPCPGCTCCVDVLYVFREDPRLSANGCFVELGTRFRDISFFLPLGLPVLDRSAFDAVLEKAEWATVPPHEVEACERAIRARLADLAADDLDIRTRAAAALVAHGYLALSATREARSQSDSGNFRARAKAVESELRPWATAGWDAMATDLGLLGSLLAYPDERVVRAAHERVQQIVPAVLGMNAASSAVWIEVHRAELKWNADEGRYRR